MSTVVVDRVDTERGELVLRRRDDVWEIISNGVFLMDSSDGTSERLLVTAALDRCEATAPRVMIGGLGVGFSVAAAVSRPEVAQVTVAEIEPALIGWHDRFLGDLTGSPLADPRVTVRVGDVLDVLREWPAGAFDGICLDTDNGPDWLVTEGNAGLYTGDGLRLLRSRLAPGGALAVWSATFDPEYDARLRTAFGQVEVLEVPRARGAPDVVWVSSTNR